MCLVTICIHVWCNKRKYKAPLHPALFAQAKEGSPKVWTIRRKIGRKGTRHKVPLLQHTIKMFVLRLYIGGLTTYWQANAFACQ